MNTSWNETERWALACQEGRNSNQLFGIVSLLNNESRKQGIIELLDRCFRNSWWSQVQILNWIRESKKNKKKSYSSGWWLVNLVLPLSLASRLKANLNLERISKNSSSDGPRALIANNPSPACPPFPFRLLFLNCNSRKAAAACCSLIMKRSMSSKQWFNIETYLSFVKDWKFLVSRSKKGERKGKEERTEDED